MAFFTNLNPVCLKNGFIMDERRSMQRFNLQVTSLITPEGSTRGSDKTKTVSSNICAGGAYFIISEPLPTGTKLEIDLHWPPKQAAHADYRKSLIKLSGEVVRTDSKGIAVAFSSKSKFVPIG